MLPEIEDVALNHLWHVTIVATAALVLARLITRRHPHIAHILLLVATVQCLLPPVVNAPFALLGGHPFVAEGTDGPPAAPAPAAESLPARESAVNVAATASPRATSDADDLSPPPSESRIVSRLDERAVTAILPLEAAPAEVPASGARPWTLALASIWLAGVSLVLGRALAGAWRVSRARRRGVAPIELVSRSARMAQRVGLHRRVKVSLLESPFGPAVSGVIRPTVLLPELLYRRCDAERLDLILAHELVHVRRHDPLIGWVALVARALWWFHPLVRWTLRELDSVRERCCDVEVVAVSGCQASTYARTLVEVLEFKRSLRPVAASPGVSPFEITQRRLEDIMNASPTRLPRGAYRCALALAAIAVIFLVPGAEPVASSDDVTPAQVSAKAPLTAPAPEPPAAAPEKSDPRQEPYRLRPFDRLKIALHRDPIGLGGEYQVEPDGRLAVGPFVGRIQAAGRTFEEVEEEISNRLSREIEGPIHVSVMKLDWANQPAPAERAGSVAAPPAERTAGLYDELVRLVTAYVDARRDLEVARFEAARAEQLSSVGKATTDEHALAKIRADAGAMKLELLEKIIHAAKKRARDDIAGAERELERALKLRESGLISQSETVAAEERRSQAEDRYEILHEIFTSVRGGKDAGR